MRTRLLNSPLLRITVSCVSTTEFRFFGMTLQMHFWPIGLTLWWKISNLSTPSAVSSAVRSAQALATDGTSQSRYEAAWLSGFSHGSKASSQYQTADFKAKNFLLVNRSSLLSPGRPVRKIVLIQINTSTNTKFPEFIYLFTFITGQGRPCPVRYNLLTGRLQ